MTDQNNDSTERRPTDGADEPEQYHVGGRVLGTPMEPSREELGRDPDREGGSSDEDSVEPPWHVRWVGQIGVYLGVIAVVLAAGGVTMAWLRIQPYGNMAITFSLVFAVVGMILGVVFQIYLGDFDVPTVH